MQAVRTLHQKLSSWPFNALEGNLEGVNIPIKSKMNIANQYSINKNGDMKTTPFVLTHIMKS